MNLACELSRGVKKSQRKTYVSLPWSRQHPPDIKDSKAELVRENANIQEQLRSSKFSMSQVQLRAVTSSPQTSKAASPASGPRSVSQAGHDGRDSDVASHVGANSARSADVHYVHAGGSSFQVTPSTLDIDRIGRRKINDCFALYVSLSPDSS
jgi:hypothetical protein